MKLSPSALVRSGVPSYAWIGLALLSLPAFTGPAAAQTATRLTILQAADRGVASPSDLAVLRTATRNPNGDIVRLALRTLGRLERVSLIPDLLPALKHSLPEVRVEAANALAQASQGFAHPPSPPVATIQSVQASLVDRLGVETDAPVRAAVREALARIPYRVAADVERAERAILEIKVDRDAIDDRLGVARALEALCRLQRDVRPATPRTIAALVGLLQPDTSRPEREWGRDARVRRLALEGLIAAGAVDVPLLAAASSDEDPQVRRLAVIAAAARNDGGEFVLRGLADPIAAVRLASVNGVAASTLPDRCHHLLTAAADPDVNVGLAAIDALAACSADQDAVSFLNAAVADRSELNAPRAWHRNAHAIVALAVAAPDRLGDHVAVYAESRIWQVRRAAATVAAGLGDRVLLDTLSSDAEDRVANVARRALGLALRPAAPPARRERVAVTARELTRLASPRARIIVKEVGRFELALVASEAPLTVVQFARLAEEGYYEGTAFEAPTGDGALQAGFRGDDRATFVQGEVGVWPHVRGTVGIAAPMTADAQFFINLVDNPSLDHRSTVFGQVLTGQDVVDRILEGDIIEAIEILP